MIVSRPESPSVDFLENDSRTPGTKHNSEYPAPAIRPSPKLLPSVATSGTRGTLCSMPGLRVF